MEPVNLGELARSNFRKYVLTLHRLLKGDDVQFDLIVAAGDSGIAMAEIAAMVYENLGIARPPTLRLPVYRHSDEAETIAYDNSVLIPEAEVALKDVEFVENILFVDDEIGSGITAFASLDITLNSLTARQRAQNVTFTIVAEDHGFRQQQARENVDPRFYPYAHETTGVWSAISCIIPADLEDPLFSLHHDHEGSSSKFRMNLLLDLPVKEFVGTRPEFTYRYSQLAEERVTNLPQLRQSFQRYLCGLIADHLGEKRLEAH